MRQRSPGQPFAGPVHAVKQRLPTPPRRNVSRLGNPGVLERRRRSGRLGVAGARPRSAPATSAVVADRTPVRRRGVADSRTAPNRETVRWGRRERPPPGVGGRARQALDRASAAELVAPSPPATRAPPRHGDRGAALHGPTPDRDYPPRAAGRSPDAGRGGAPARAAPVEQSEHFRKPDPIEQPIDELPCLDRALRQAAERRRVPRCCPPPPTKSPARGSPASGPSPAPDTPPTLRTPAVNTLLPSAHGTRSTFTPHREHDTRHGVYCSHTGIRPHGRCRHTRGGRRSYRSGPPSECRRSPTRPAAASALWTPNDDRQQDGRTLPDQDPGRALRRNDRPGTGGHPDRSPPMARSRADPRPQ